MHFINYFYIDTTLMALRQCDEPPRRVTHGQLPLPSGPSAPKQIPTYKQKPSPPKHAMELIEGICMYYFVILLKI